MKFKVSIFFILYFFLLTPILKLNVINVHTGYVVLLCLFLFKKSFFNEIINNKPFLLTCFLFYLFWVNYLINSILYFNNWGFDFIFFKVTSSFLICVVFGYFLRIYIEKGKAEDINSFDFIFNLTFLIVLFNSMIVLMEVIFPEFKSIVESILVPNDGGINYDAKTGRGTIRFRGFANTGGAILSIFHSIIGLLFFWFAAIHFKLTHIRFILIFIIICLSLLFIGRTGILNLIIFLPVIYILKSTISLQPKMIFFILFVLLIVFYLPILLEAYMTPFMYEYSFSFFLKGLEGLKQEGTVDKITAFYHYPFDPFKLFFGIGYYQGSFIHSWGVDAGYMKSFTSMGLLGSLIFYLIPLYLIIMIFIRNNISMHIKAAYLILYFIILFNEIKEPTLAQGPAGRFFLCLLGFGLAEKRTFT